MKFIDDKNTGLYRGSILRFHSAQDPFEPNVDFMICHYPSVDDTCCPMALYCITGYHAGQLECIFPIEAMFNNNPRCISKNWIVRNWTKSVQNCTNIFEADLIV